MKPLTAAQERLLREINAAGVRVYGGRSLKPLQALEARGLIALDVDMRPQSKGNGIELVYSLTASALIPDFDPN